MTQAALNAIKPASSEVLDMNPSNSLDVMDSKKKSLMAGGFSVSLYTRWTDCNVSKNSNFSQLSMRKYVYICENHLVSIDGKVCQVQLLEGMLGNSCERPQLEGGVPP